MQFSLFGAAVSEPTRADLNGLMLAGAHWVRAQVEGSEQARLSVLVDDAWRVDALLAELAERDMPAEPVLTETGQLGVHTDFAADLVELARRWTRGALIGPPDDLALSAAGLRLWAVASGHRDDIGYLLGTPDVQSRTHYVAGAQLAGLGLTAVGIGERGRPGWRITGQKRLRRFAELVGEPPAGCGEDWAS